MSVRSLHGLAPPWPRGVRLALQVALYEAAWLAGVLGAAQGHAEAGIAAVAAVVAVRMACSDSPRHEAALVAFAAVLGLGFDSLLAASGLVAYAGSQTPSALAPAWIVAQWVLFATLLREPLAWLHRRLALASLLGAVGGPLAYLAGERLGACSLADPGPAIGALALGWAVATPLLLVLARRPAGGAA